MPTEHISVTRVTAKANEDRTAILLSVTEPDGRERGFAMRPEYVDGLITAIENARMLCRAKAGARPPRGQRLVT